MTGYGENFSRLDLALAGFLVSHSLYAVESTEAGRLRQVIKELSAALAAGHSCINLDTDGQVLLQASGLVAADGSKPLVLQGGLLYLQRYWQYEARLAQQIKERVQRRRPPHPQLPQMLERYFPRQDDQFDWQKQAAENVSTQAFSIVTGGPGTGKTTTVLKILAILLEQEEGGLNIAMAAPTGKAAMRLQESIGEGKARLNCTEQARDRIPDEVSTIHRLLGARPGSPYFKHNADHPLVYDLVVIDEASMVDLALMAKLVDALRPSARLILLGDKDQLASVESGAILSDLSQALPGNTSELKRSFRFEAGIKEFAEAINHKDKDLAWELLQGNENQRCNLVRQDALGHIMACSQDFFSAVNNGLDAEKVFAAYKQFQVLCSNRRGRLGVAGINQSVEQQLARRGVNVARPWYAGKPVIITRNDSSSGLYNGDIGICLPYESQLYMHFEMPDGQIKRFLPARLPHYETAYALTVHKSQGSEFERVLVMLPETPNPVLGKELLYTAVTRAKKQVDIASSRAVFDYALSHQVERYSGLKTRLMQD